jgi:hypothetical protein
LDVASLIPRDPLDEALHGLAGTELEPDLIERFESALGGPKRNRAIDALAAVGNARAVEALVRAVEGQRVETDLHLFLALHGVGTPTARAAIEVLLGAADPEAASDMRQILKVADEPRVSLDPSLSDTAPHPMRAEDLALDMSDPSIAASTLGLRPLREASAHLRRLLRDPDRNVRIGAVAAFGRGHGAAARPLLLLALKDRDPGVRQNAALHLWRLTGTDVHRRRRRRR